MATSTRSKSPADAEFEAFRLQKDRAEFEEMQAQRAAEQQHVADEAAFEAAYSAFQDAEPEHSARYSTLSAELREAFTVAIADFTDKVAVEHAKLMTLRTAAAAAHRVAYPSGAVPDELRGSYGSPAADVVGGVLRGLLQDITPQTSMSFRMSA